MTTSSTSATTISLMRKSFASLGLPEVIVSDNATNFTSDEFDLFLKKNGVKHVKTPPYHPASNGLAERAVQTFKEGMRKLKDGSLDTKLSRFLFKYRTLLHYIKIVCNFYLVCVIRICSTTLCCARGNNFYGKKNFNS